MVNDGMPARRFQIQLILTIAMMSWAGLGCSGRPPRLKQQTLNPAAAAAAAMSEYDSDANGAIDKAELDQSPPLKSALSQFDKDGDGAISQAEIESRLNSWIENKSALFPIPCTVLKRGQPVAGATVIFEPESFLGDSFVRVTGRTGTDGMAELSVEEGPFTGLPGIPNGLYRIRISQIVDERERIPEKYNENTTLGQEISDDAGGLGRGLIFEL